MGKQVPDISPEGLKELTDNYRANVDREAIFYLMKDGQEDYTKFLTFWRESAGISKAGTARLMGMSQYGYLKVENGYVPLTDHFLATLRFLLNKLDTTGFDFHPSDKSKSAMPFRDFYEKHIPRKKIASKNGEWRMCGNPTCKDPWKFFHLKKKRYCSKRCSDYMAQHKKIDGFITKTPVDRRTNRRQYVKCPQCQNEFATRGNVISGDSKSSSHYPHKGRWKTDDDPKEQVHQEVGSLLPDGLLPHNKSSLQSGE